MDLKEISSQLYNELNNVEMEKGYNSIEYLELKEIIVKTQIYIKKYSL